MSIVRRIGVALTIAGSVLTLVAAAPHLLSPGYTYRLKIDGRVTDPDGATKTYVVLSGRAMVTEKGGRLDIDEASKERGAMAEKGSYILYDPTSMMIVSPKDRQILKFSFANLEQGLSLANVPRARMTISDVVVGVEKLGAGGPILGMATTKYRLTQDYEITADHSSTEHVVQDVWMAAEKKGFANPFARMGQIRAGAGNALSELLARTAEAESQMGRGIPLKTVTSTTSMWSRNEATKSVSTMEVTDLQAGNVDDALLTAPADYRVTDVDGQMKAIASPPGQSAPAEAVSVPAKADSAPSAKPAPKRAETDAAAEAKQGMVKALHGMVRRP